MSEEEKNRRPRQRRSSPKTAPRKRPLSRSARTKAEGKPEEARKGGGWFNKKAREMEAVKAKLDAAEKKNAAQAKDQLLRMAAEYDNYRKRSTREADQKFNDGVSFAVNQIIPILDTLDMAANAPTTDENYKKGVMMTLDKAAKALEALHVEEIEALGKPFDPNFMNAVQQIPAPKGRRAAPSSRFTRRATSWATRSSATRPSSWPNNKANRRVLNKTSVSIKLSIH